MMRGVAILAATAVMMLSEGLAWPQARTKPRPPAPAITIRQTVPGPIIPFAVSNGSVTGSISITSSNPDGGPVTGSGTTTVSFKTTANPAAFRVWAQALSSSFTGCNSPAASAVAVACQTASTGVSCAPAATLSTSAPPAATLVASGSGNHNPNTITVQYTFQDAWNYQAGTACALSVQYIYTEP